MAKVSCENCSLKERKPQNATFIGNTQLNVSYRVWPPSLECDFSEQVNGAAHVPIRILFFESQLFLHPCKWQVSYRVLFMYNRFFFMKQWREKKHPDPSHISATALLSALRNSPTAELSVVWLSFEESVQFCTKWCNWHTTLYFCE